MNKMNNDKILIIEDDHKIRTNIRELLMEVGFKVFSSTDGKEGILLAEEVNPALIICDIMMPGMDGYEVFSNINEKLNIPVPFIFLTAKSEPDDLRKGMTLGADDYITKPFKASDLINAVKVRLEKYKQIKNASAQQRIKEFNKERKKPDEKILLKYKNRTEFIKIDDISCIISEKEYSKVFLINNRSILMRRLLKNWEEILPSSFLRIHRSYLININQIAQIQTGYNGTFLIKLNNHSETFISSRRYLNSIKEKLCK
jgi:DNA-binding LytR/AlgR family response regulator